MSCIGPIIVIQQRVSVIGKDIDCVVLLICLSDKKLVCNFGRIYWVLLRLVTISYGSLRRHPILTLRAIAALLWAIKPSLIGVIYYF